MMVNVRLLGYLAKYSPTGKETFKLELASEATIGWLLEKMKFPPDTEKIVLVNGYQSSHSNLLADGDEVFIFAPAAGG